VIPPRVFVVGVDLQFQNGWANALPPAASQLLAPYRRASPPLGFAGASPIFMPPGYRPQHNNAGATRDPDDDGQLAPGAFAKTLAHHSFGFELDEPERKSVPLYLGGNEPVRAWRIWRVDFSRWPDSPFDPPIKLDGISPRLSSVGQATVWPAREALHARCQRSFFAVSSSHATIEEGGHPAPNPDAGCDCGIWGFKDPWKVEQALAFYGHEERMLTGPHNDVMAIGLVQLWGRVVQCVDTTGEVSGWRGEFAYPHSLVLRGPHANALLAAELEVVYGVPCSVSDVPIPNPRRMTAISQMQQMQNATIQLGISAATAAEQLTEAFKQAGAAIARANQLIRRNVNRVKWTSRLMYLLAALNLFVAIFVADHLLVQFADGLSAGIVLALGLKLHRRWRRAERTLGLR
jgi:hypothetical protein